MSLAGEMKLRKDVLVYINQPKSETIDGIIIAGIFLAIPRYVWLKSLSLNI